MIELARRCYESGPSEPWTTAETNTFLFAVAVYLVVGTYVWYRTAGNMAAMTRVVPGGSVPDTPEPKHDMSDVIIVSIVMGLFWPVAVPGWALAQTTRRMFSRKGE